MNRAGWLVKKYQKSLDGSLAIFSKNRVLTYVVILRNKTGGSFQIDPTFVGSF